MNSLKIAAICLLLLPFCGCDPVASFYPLGNEQQAVLDARVLGEWKGVKPENDLMIQIAESQDKTYLVKFTEQEKGSGKVEEVRCAGRLINLDDRLFFDLFDFEAAGNSKLEEQDYPLRMYMHSFMRVDFDGDAVKFAFLDDEELDKKVEAKAIDLPLLKRDGTILLAAQTPVLRKVMAQIGGDQTLWEDLGTYHRAATP
jgi:hypothetical protein